MYFLDTNTCIYYLNGRYSSILDKFKRTNADLIVIPAIVKAELYYGAEKSLKKKINLNILDSFLCPFQIADFNSDSAIEYARIRADLEKKGTPIGPNDLMIASIVKANNGILVTNNTAEFGRISGLHIENWAI